MIVKKRKISYKKIFIFILILDVLVFGTVKTVSFVKEKFSNHRVEKYLASSETSIKLYSLDFTESMDIVRGTKVEEYEKKVTNKDTNEVYTKIKYNDKDYLLKEDVVTKDDVKVAGMSAMVLDTMNLSNEEIVAYVIIAVILCLIVLMISLDSYLVPILLLLNIGIAILFNMGTISAVLQLGVTTDFSIFLYHK